MFKFRRVYQSLNRSGFDVESVWVDAISVSGERAFIGIKVVDEPIRDPLVADLGEAIAHWGKLIDVSPARRQAEYIALILVHRPEFVGLAQGGAQ